jgi:hypothetical protein
MKYKCTDYLLDDEEDEYMDYNSKKRTGVKPLRSKVKTFGNNKKAKKFKKSKFSDNGRGTLYNE